MSEDVRCFYCGEFIYDQKAFATYPHPRMRTQDHVKPKAGGGKNKQSNLVDCCYACNQLKANHGTKKFRRLLRRWLELTEPVVFFSEGGDYETTRLYSKPFVHQWHMRRRKAMFEGKLT